MNREITIGDRAVGPGNPVYVIAELSANHGQNFFSAVELVKAAAHSGADAVKLQTYTADTITVDADQPWFRIGGGTAWDGATLYSLYQKAYTPWEWQPELAKLAASLGIHLFSTPFDFTAVDFLEKMNVPAYKIASFELVDLPLISRAAATGKPMILSTGMATFEEIEEAVATVRGVGNDQIILLKCTSDYPASPEHMNLRTIPDLAERLQVIVGLSDHSMVPEPVVAAVALGANVIEKHLTLRRSDGGPDAGFSLEPEEFRKMVDSVRATEQSLGKIRYEPTEREEGCRRLRKSLFAVRDIASGDVITEENLRSIRPGNGLHTRHYREIVGNWRAKTLISKGTPMAWELIEKIP